MRYPIQWRMINDKIDGLAQDCSNSSALAMELQQSCNKPSKWCLWTGLYIFQASAIYISIISHIYLFLSIIARSACDRVIWWRHQFHEESPAHTHTNSRKHVHLITNIKSSLTIKRHVQIPYSIRFRDEKPIWRVSICEALKGPMKNVYFLLSDMCIHLIRGNCIL